MKQRNAISNALGAFLLFSLLLLGSCASNDSLDKAANKDNDFASFGDDDSIGSDLELLDDGGADDLEMLGDTGGSSSEMAELESEFAEMGFESEDTNNTQALDEATMDSEPPVASGDDDLDQLLEGGGEVAPESYPEDNFADSYSPNSGSRTAIVSQSPQISTEAFEKGGALLNRFYFARKGDSWNSIAQTLYGSTERSMALQTWNGRRLRPGTLVYYESPSNRSDARMISYFEERGVQPSPYALQRGETLSLLAQKQYGDGRSWKEIAALNGIGSPDAVKVGTQLMLYPGNSYTESYADTSIQDTRAAAPMPSTTPEQPSLEPEPDYSGFDNAAIAPPVVQAPPAYSPPPPPPPPVTRRPRVSTSRLIQQNMFAFAIAGIVIVLLIALFVLNKRKKASALHQEDLIDDGFAAPPRAGRR